MQPFTRLSGIAAPLRLMNVDTDMIIPKQYLKTIARTGLAKGLFAELRWHEDGQINPEFVLNKEPYTKSSLLIAGANFGCGSSREHAPWALLDSGIRCIIAPSFADIFYNNCFKNGILPIIMPQDTIETLWQDAEQQPSSEMTVDLAGQQLISHNTVYAFEIDPFRKKCLLEGLDDIGLTLAYATSIERYEHNNRLTQPWI